MKRVFLFCFILVGIFSFKYVYENYIKPISFYHIEDFQSPSKPITLNAGKIIRFSFKNTFDNIESFCELRVPDEYGINHKFPIFVWFSPGHGSYKVKDIPNFVDRKKYFLLALPYKNNQLPRLAIKDGYIDELWDYDSSMLAFVKSVIPNLSSKIRLVGGFSSGAHMIGSGLDKNWQGFTDFFTGYIIHEGGGAPTMMYEGIKPSDKILLTYGEKSNGFGEYVAKAMTDNHNNITVRALPNTAHEISSETVSIVSLWIKQNFE